MSLARWLKNLQLVGSTALAAALLCCVLATSAGAVEYVVNISVDGLRSDAISNWVDDLDNNYLPNFRKLRDEGAWTDNARTDYYKTCTNPGHANILTGRPVRDGFDWEGNPMKGHLWDENRAKISDPWAAYGLTFHDPHTAGQRYNNRRYPRRGLTKSSYEYVSSVFDVAHDAGKSTGLYAGKNRLGMYVHSYDEYHSEDSEGNLSNVSKIDDYLVQHINRKDRNSGQLIDQWKEQMGDDPLNYSFIHFADTDFLGHKRGWKTKGINTAYMNTVKDIDGWLGDIFAVIDENENMQGNTAIVLTSDHGGQGRGHKNPTRLNDYKVPFYVWGPGIGDPDTGGVDLYGLNSGLYYDPGDERPTHDEERQPIRNGFSANLVLSLLELDSIEDSSLNFYQDLNVFGTSTEPLLLGGSGLSFNTSQILPVPEPSATALLLSGAVCLLAIAALLRRREMSKPGVV